MKSMLNLCMACMMILMACMMAGCGTTGLFASSQTDKNTVAPTDRDRDVLLKAIAENQTTLATKLDSNVEKGLVIKNKSTDVVRDTAGQVVVINTADGPKTLIASSEIDVRLNSFHELASQLNGLELNVATKADVQAGTNQIYGGTQFDGLRLKIQSSGGGSTLNPDNIRAPYEGRSLETQARADLFEAYWKGRTGYAATVITTAGEAVTGIVKEVLKVTTPGGQAVAIAELALETAAGRRVVQTSKEAKPATE